MPLAILFSSGKDSTATLHYYLEQGWEVACLCSLLPENEDSWMFQRPSVELLRAQASALQLPLIAQASRGEKERELEDLRLLLLNAKAQHGIDGVAVGAVASDYQHERVNRICHELELKTFAPLWHKDQERLMRDMIDAGFDVRMTRIAADGLDRSWLNKRLTHQDVDKLTVLNTRLGLHVAGEGGEFETIVLDGPIFAQPITIAASPIMESECRGELVITRVY